MTHDDFMKEALALAEKAFSDGEFPVGCVIADQNRVVARGSRRRSAGPMARDAAAGCSASTPQRAVDDFISARIAGNDERGLLYGTGRFLRDATGDDRGLAHAARLRQGTVVAEVVVGEDRHPLRAGVETVEWARAREDISGVAAHGLPPGEREHIPLPPLPGGPPEPCAECPTS